MAEIDSGPDLNRSLHYARRIQTAALLVAFIAAGAYVAVPIPVSPVPVVLQNFFVVFTGFVLPPGWAALTLATYLGMGAVGLPVFAGATGGLAHFAGPTGGFLAGFLVSAWITSVVVRGPDTPSRTKTIGAVGLGFLVPYLTGVPWLASVTGLSLGEALVVGALPFLPGDLIKGILLVVLVHRIPESVRRRVK